MFISWRSKLVKGQAGFKFLHGQWGDEWSREYAWHSVKCEHTGAGRIAWTPFLIKAERIDGKPRQKILYRFPTIRSCCIADARNRAAWWYFVQFIYECWGQSIGGIDDEGHYRDWPACLAKIREVVPDPSRRAKAEFAKFAAEFDRAETERIEAERQREREWREAERRRRTEEEARVKAESDRRRWESFRDVFDSGHNPAGDFATLGLSPSATMEQVKARFRELAKQHHPDKGGDAAKFRLYREAYDRIIKTDPVGAR